MQLMVRLADRAVLQFGTSLGEMRDDKGVEIPTEIVTPTEQQLEALKVAYAQPHSLVYISAAGVVTFDPPLPPPPPTPEDLAFAADAQICRDFLAKIAPTAADVVAATKAHMRVTARIVKELR
jgi:hypothetical protein